jgi:zinc/manganese transport system permease protein
VSTWDLLQVDFVQNALWASLLLGVSVTVGAVAGAVLASLVLALLGMREQDSTTGVVLAFGMGLSVLFIYLYPGRTSEAYALLTGQIVGVSGASLGTLAVVTAVVVVVVGVLWRPLLFSTVDPVLAAASGVKVKLLAAVFAVIIGVVASQGVQIVGALLLLALLITPGAAAVKVTANPALAVVLSACFAVVSAAGGLVLSLGPGLPVSPFVTSISFAIYLVCRIIGYLRGRRVSRDTSRDATRDTADLPPEPAEAEPGAGSHHH